MKAFDPETGGVIEVHFAQGPYYTEYCPDCGRTNGVWVDTPETPVPRAPCAEWTGRCVWCDGGKTEYVLLAGWDGAVE